MILEESLVGSPLVQIVWQRLQRPRVEVLRANTTGQAVASRYSFFLPPNIPQILYHVFLFFRGTQTHSRYYYHISLWRKKQKYIPAAIIITYVSIYQRYLKKYVLHKACPSFSSDTQKSIGYIIACLYVVFFIFRHTQNYTKHLLNCWVSNRYMRRHVLRVCDFFFFIHTNSMIVCCAHCMNYVLMYRTLYVTG